MFEISLLLAVPRSRTSKTHSFPPVAGRPSSLADIHAIIMSPRLTERNLMAHDTRLKNGGCPEGEGPLTSIHHGPSALLMSRSRSLDAQATSVHRSGDSGSADEPPLMRSVSLSHGSVIGLPSRPNAMLGAERSVKAKRRAMPAVSNAQSHHGAHHVPRLSISSEEGDSIEVNDVDAHVHRSMSRTHKHDTSSHVHDMVMETAMEIIEELAMICDTMWPPPTDICLASAGLSDHVVGHFEVWLNTRFDYYPSKQRLMEDYVTAEFLAAEIIAQSTQLRPEPLVSETLGADVRRDKQPQFGSPVSPKGNRIVGQQRSREDSRLLSATAPSSRRVRKELTVKVVEPTWNASQPTPPPLSANASRSRSPHSLSPRFFKHSRNDSSLPAAGKKTGGIMLGLLTVGSMLSSPLHAQFDSPVSGSLQRYDVPSAGVSYGFSGMHSPYYGQRSPQPERMKDYGGSQILYGAAISPSGMPQSGTRPLLFVDASS